MFNVLANIYSDTEATTTSQANTRYCILNTDVPTKLLIHYYECSNDVVGDGSSSSISSSSKCEVEPVHAMKAYKVSRLTAALIIDLGTSRR